MRYVYNILQKSAAQNKYFCDLKFINKGRCFGILLSSYYFVKSGIWTKK